LDSHQGCFAPHTESEAQQELALRRLLARIEGELVRCCATTREIYNFHDREVGSTTEFTPTFLGSITPRRSVEFAAARMKFTFETMPTGSRMSGVTRFPSIEAMEKVAAGMEEGLRAATVDRKLGVEEFERLLEAR
jgi:hypothetical protein